MWQRQMIRLAAATAVSAMAGGLGMATADAAAVHAGHFTPSIPAASWTKQATQPQASSANGPALAVFDGRLYAAWTGRTTNKLFYASYNGHTWTKQATEPQASSGSAPALAVFDGRLYAAWTGRTTNKLFYASYNGHTWTKQATEPQAKTGSSP